MAVGGASRRSATTGSSQALLSAGDALFVEPEAYREAFALETPTLVLVVGGVPGEAYEPPGFHLDAGA